MTPEPYRSTHKPRVVEHSEHVITIEVDMMSVLCDPHYFDESNREAYERGVERGRQFRKAVEDEFFRRVFGDERW